MEIVAQRLLFLRESLKMTQSQVAGLSGVAQTNVYRYETGKSSPPLSLLVWYADYFDVSLDYIFGRTDDPRGKLYDYNPEALKEKTAKNEELREFVEMCFDPNSPMSGRLKEALFRMLQDGGEGE